MNNYYMHLTKTLGGIMKNFTLTTQPCALDEYIKINNIKTECLDKKGNQVFFKIDSRLEIVKKENTKITKEIIEEQVFWERRKHIEKSENQQIQNSMIKNLIRFVKNTINTFCTKIIHKHSTVCTDKI